MQNISKRLLSLLMVIAMVLSMVPFNALTANAAEVDPATAVAKIGNVYYETLADAVAAAETGDTIVLTEDLSLTATQYVEKEVTIDLGGNTLSATGCRALVANTASGKLTVQNGEVTSNASGTVTSNYNATVILGKNLTVRSTGNFGVYVNRATLEVPETTVKVYGNSRAVSFKNGDTYTISISGGAYSHAITADWIVGEYTSSWQSIDGQQMFVITPLVVKEIVATVNGVEYETLAAAVAAAQNGDTVVLAKDQALTEAQYVEKEITIDLGGFTLSSTGCRTLVANTGSGKLTIQNGKVTSDTSGTVTSNYNATVILGKDLIVESTGNFGVYVNRGTLLVPENSVKVYGKNRAVSFKSGDTYTITISGGAYSHAITAEWLAAGSTASWKDVDGTTMYVVSHEHDWVKGETVAPTFDAEGYTIYTCSRCGESEKRDIVSALVVVAQVGDIYYKSLQAAINACVAGDNTITLLAGTDENVIVKQAAGVNVVIDGNGNTYSGRITIHGSGRSDGAETLKITNMKFESDKAEHYFIESNNGSDAQQRYPHNVIVEKCQFNATGAGVNSAAAMRIRQGFRITISDVEATNLHSVLQAYGCTDITVSNVKITGKNGISTGTSTNVKVSGVDFDVTGYGIRLDAEANNNAVIEDCAIKAFIPVVIRKADTAGNITIKGTNTMTATNTDRMWLVIGKTEYEAGKALPTDGQDLITVTLSDPAMAKGVHGRKVTGSVTSAFTSGNAFWGEGGGNAYQSLVVKLYEGDKVIATASLNNIDGIIDGDVGVTWNIPFTPNGDSYWNVTWAEGYPNIEMAPTKVAMIIDGVEVATNTVQLNAPDDLHKIVAAATKNGEFVGYFTKLSDAVAAGDLVYIRQGNEFVKAVAKVGTSAYLTLQEAIDAAKNGDTVTLMSDVKENVTVTEAVGKYITIDGAGYKLYGTVIVKALSDENDNRRTTIKNVNFVDETDANVDFIYSVETNHYPRITVEGCSFTGNGADVAVRLKSSYSVVIKDSTGTGLHSFLQNTSGRNLTLENITVTNSKSGLALGTVQDVTVKGCTIDVAGYGIRLDADTYNNNAVIESNTVKAFIPVVVRKVNTNGNLTFQGTNTMTATNTDGLWCVIGSTEYEENGKLPTVGNFVINVDLQDTGLDADGIYQVSAKGTWGGIDWVLDADGTLTIAPTKGTPTQIKNRPKQFTVGQWPEAVRYNSKGEGVAIEGWPYDRAKVKKLVIEEGVTSIGSFTAQSLTNLTGEVVIPSTVTYIGQEAFMKSTMTKLTFAAGGSEELCIAQGAFKNLIIEEVTLPVDRPVHLHAWVFNNCHNLKTVYISATATSFHGTNHIDYFKDFNAHSNPTWTHASEIFAYNKNMETITFENEAVKDQFYSTNNGTNKDYTVATVGLTTYFDWEDAFNAIKAANGEIEVTLLKSITMTEMLTISANQSITLNLNGKTINVAYAEGSTTNHIYAIENHGNLTIAGTGTINARGIFNYGDLVLEKATINAIDGNGGYGVRNYPGATFTMNGGKIATTLEDDNKVNEGGYDATTVRVDEGATFTMNGGVLNNICDFTFAIDNYGTAIVNGGTITSVHSTVSTYGTLTINGGTFTCKGLEGVTAHALVAWNGSTTIINGGTFDGKDNYNGFNVDTEEGAKVEIKGGTFLSTHSGSLYGEGSIVVSGGNFYDKIDKDRCAEGFAPILNENGTYDVIVALHGEGTEAAPYLIRSVTDLVLFRDSVNDGATKYNAPGVYVALDADIDMAGIDWSNNIGDACNTTFDGIFDGKGHTISNLTSVETAKTADGYVCTGLFGAIYGNAVIKNLTIDKANITAAYVGNNAGIVVGFAYASTGTIENVKVTNSTLNASAVTGTGAIVGYAYQGSLTIKDCSVENTNVIGQSYVGGIIGYTDTNNSIIGTSFANGEIKANAAAAGGITGIVNGNATIKDCSVNGVQISANHANWANSAAAAVGTINGKVTVTGLDTDVTLPVVGAIHAEKPTAPVSKIEAKIGDVYFATIEKAVAAANEGETIELLVPIVIAAGEELKLDKKVTITYTSNVAGEDMFTNRGTLIVDGATLVYTNTDTTASNVTVSTISSEAGSVLVINDGAVKNESENNGAKGIYAFAIDLLTNGNLGNVTATINGGEVISTNYMAIRQFNNGTACTNALTVNGGTIYGAKRAIQIHMDNNAAQLTVNGGTIEADEGGYALCLFPKNATQIAINGGTFNGSVYSGSAGIIYGGTYSEEVYEGYCAEGLIPTENADGTFGVKTGKYVARVNGAGYETIEAAIKAAKTGETVTILEGTYTMPAMKAGITIEGQGDVLLNGTLSGTLENLTLKNLHIKGGNAQRWAYAKGNLVFEKVTFEATGVYALHFDGITEGATLTYKDCTIIGWAAMSGSPASCVFEGCTFKGNGTYGLIRTYFDATIENCTFDVANVNTTDVYQDGIHAVSGADVVVNNCTNVNGDMVDIANISGTSTINVDGVVIKHLAKAGDRYYRTLKEAFESVQNGETVTLLDNIVLDSETYTIADGKSVTLDMNGKQITVTDNKTGNYELFYIYGAMTVTGNGTIEMTATNDRDWNASSSIFHNRGGVLNIENGTFTHKGGTDMAYVVDNSGNWFGDATTNITAGTLTSTYIAIRNRMEENSHGASGKATLNVYGGTINGTSRAIWAQAASTSTTAPATGAINISGGNIGLIDTARSAGAESMTTISGGTVAAFKGEVGELTVKGGTLESATIMDASGNQIDYVITAEGLYIAAAAKIGTTNFATVAEAFAAAQAGDEVVILAAGQYAVPTGKSITITGAVDGVAFGNIGACGMNGANVTFNNVTFNYAVNSTYQGLQHSGNLVYNNCTINGQVFLYGQSETFNNCTFNNTGDNYNVWTYGAKEVAFNECTFNCDGKSVLIYAEGANVSNDVTVTNSTFKASKAVEGKAAIEMDSSLTAGIKLTVTNSTATGFGNGNVSGNSLWNNKKGNNTDANNDITVVVNDETVLAPVNFVAYVGTNGYTTLADAFAAAQAGNTIVLDEDLALADETIKVNGNVILDLNGKTITGTETSTKSFALIEVQPEAKLTVTGNGTITLTAANNRGWNAFSSVISNQRGTLVVENGTIEHLGGTDMAYAIDSLTNTGAQNVVTTINGGTIKSTYRAIRQFANSTSAQNILTVNGGTIEGANKSIWMQQANAKANPAATTVAAAATLKGNVLLSAGEGATEWPVTVSIAAAALADGTEVQANANVPAGYELAKIDGNYTVMNGAAKIGNIYYATLEDALKAVKADETITLVRDITIADKWDSRYTGAKITANNVTIDGAGKKITFTGEISDMNWNTLFRAEGDIFTVKNLTIDASAATGIQRGISAKGSLVVDNCTFIGNGTKYGVMFGEGAGAAISNVTATITNSKFINWGRGISDNANGQNAKTVTVTGNTFENASVAVSAAEKVTFTGNTVADDSFVSITSYGSTITMEVVATGNTMNENAKTFVSKAVSYDNIQEEFIVKAAVAVSNDTETKYFNDLAVAIAAAQARDVVTLNADAKASEVILIDKSLTINGNGHKVTSSATRVFRVTTANVEVTLNDVNMVNTAVRVGSNDIRGISIDAVDGVKLTLNNCSVDFTDASACDWAYAVNVTGGSYTTLTVSGGTYEGANVINVRGAKQTVVVKDATLTSLYPNNDVYYGACIYVVQHAESSVVATGNTFNGSNTVAFNAGYTPVTESNNTDNTTLVVAKIGNTYYTSLAAAFAAAQDGDTIEVLQNTEVTEGITNTKKVTLDLNGKTITGTDNATASFAVITNKSELTITGNGTITLTATNNRGWNAYSSVISNTVGGKLIVENGTIEHLGGTDMAYAIDNLTNGKDTYAETVINGGTIKSTYRAVRMFLNGVEAQNILTVNGGTIEGVKSIWMQDPSANANSGKLTVGENATLNGDVYLSVTAGSTAWPVDVSIAAAALADGTEVQANANVPAGYELAKIDGNYTVKNGVAKIDTAYYATLAEAFAAAQAGQTITMVKDIALADETIKVNGNVTLDLNGKTITGSETATASFALFEIQPEAKLTVNGEGTITLIAANDRGWGAYSSVISNQRGTLIVNGGTIEHLGGTAMAYAIDSLTNTGAQKAETVINGGTIKSTYRAIRQFVNSAYAQNILIVNGGTIEGGNKSIWLQDANANANPAAITVAPEATLVGDVYLTAAAGSTEWPVSVSIAAENNVLTNELPGKLVVFNNGTVWTTATAVAEINGTRYATLTAAIKAAKAGDTITLVADVNESVNIDKAITLDGNGFSYSGNMKLGEKIAKSSSVTIKNVNFVNGYIYRNNNSNVMAKLTVKDCSFDGAGKKNYAINPRSINNIVVEGCSAENFIYGFFYSNKALDSLTIKDLTVTGMPSYAICVQSYNKLVLEDIVATNCEVGLILFGNTANSDITIKDCKLIATTPIEIYKGNGNVQTIKFKGVNDVNTTELNLGDYGVIANGAQIGTKIYESMQAAINAAQDGDTIKLIADLNLTKADEVLVDGMTTFAAVQGKKVTIDLNGKNINANCEGVSKTFIGVFSALNDGNLTIVDSKESAKVNLTGNAYAMVTAFEAGAFVTINGGSFYAESCSSSLLYSGGANGLMTVNGGSFKLGNLGTGANGSPWIFNTYQNNQFHAIVNGGTFSADVNHQFWACEVLVPETKALQNNGNGTWTVVEAVAYVVEIENEYERKVGYATLAEALASEHGDTVVLVMDIDLGESVVTVAAGQIKTLDLNGKTLSGTDKTSKNYGLIQNNGTLTINDTVGGGKITVSATINSGWGRYSAVISNNPGGTLTVNGGTIEHLGGTDMAYGIDSLTNGNLGNVSVTINGGTIKSTYRGIRQFLNSASMQNELVINGGTIEGANKSIFFHDPSKNANNGKLIVGKDATLKGDVYLYVTEGSTAWPVEVSIAKAAVNGEVISANVPVGYEVVVIDGAYTVKHGAARIENTYYETLAAALEAAQAGETITLVKDLTLNEITKIEKEVTIDLNKKTVTGTAKKVFEVYANATIMNGSIIGENRCVDTRKAVELTLDGVNLTADKFSSVNGNSQPLTIGGSENGTKVKMTNVNINAGTQGYGIITFVKTELKAANSTISGYSALYVKAGSENSVFNFEGSTLIGINEGNDVEGNSFSTIAVRADDVTVAMDAASELTADGNYMYALSLGSSYEGEESVKNVKITIEGIIEGNIVPQYALNGNVVSVRAAYADELKAKGFAVKTSNGMATIIAAVEIYDDWGDLVGSFLTLQDAIDAAEDGDTIILQADIYVDTVQKKALAGKYDCIYLISGKAVTIDLNGKDITANAKNSSQLVGLFALENDGELTINDSSCRNKYEVSDADVKLLSGTKEGTYNVYGMIVAFEDGVYVEINGGNFYANEVSDSLIYTGAAAGDDITGNDMSVVINGGNFELGNVGKGPKGNGSPWIFNAYGQNTNHVNVMGGTFNADVNHQYWVFEVDISEKYALRNNGDGTWTVVNAVAYVTEHEWSGKWYTRKVGYATLQEAVAACEGAKSKTIGKNVYTVEAETVVLRRDIKLTEDLYIENHVTIDYNGHKITGGEVIKKDAPQEQGE